MQVSGLLRFLSLKFFLTCFVDGVWAKRTSCSSFSCPTRCPASLPPGSSGQWKRRCSQRTDSLCLWKSHRFEIPQISLFSLWSCVGCAHKQSFNLWQEEEAEENSCSLKDLREGLVGKMLVRRSGRVQLVLGQVTLDVSLGTSCSFLQVYQHYILILFVSMNPHGLSSSLSHNCSHFFILYTLTKLQIFLTLFFTAPSLSRSWSLFKHKKKQAMLQF